MRQLLLMRHAKSAWDNPQLSDFERPLNPRGKKAAKLMGSFMANNNMSPNLVLCSAANRTKETLKLLMPHFSDETQINYLNILYEGTVSDYLNEIANKGKNHNSILIIGHSPIIQVLALNLIKNTDSKDCARVAHHFPTAALANIELDLKFWSKLELRHGTLQGYYLPRELEKN